jgi:hypothetical protein
MAGLKIIARWFEGAPGIEMGVETTAGNWLAKDIGLIKVLLDNVKEYQNT